MELSPFGRVLFGALAALLAWFVVGAVRRADTLAAVTAGLMALMYGLPAVFGRDSFTAHTFPVPRWLRWMYRAPAAGVHAPVKSPAP